MQIFPFFFLFFALFLKQLRTSGCFFFLKVRGGMRRSRRSRREEGWERVRERKGLKPLADEAYVGLEQKRQFFVLLLLL